MIDLQINGYVGVDFNDPAMSEDAFRRACQRLLDDGVTGCLPTVITGDVAHMSACLANIAAYRERDALVQQVVCGVHIEGPFLNERPGYIGAHPAQHARDADVDVMRRLLDASRGLTRIVTLAPERDRGGKLTRWLADQGIVVAAGHSDASLAELQEAIDCGLSMMTHLGNGCPLLMHRHDNIIQRVLSLSPALWVSVIADGAHLPWFAFGNYVARIGLDRTVVVSDAISAAGLGPDTFPLAGQTVRVGDDLVPRAEDDSHFVGSATTMQRACENLLAQGYSRDVIRQWTLDNPQRVLRSSCS